MDTGQITAPPRAVSVARQVLALGVDSPTGVEVGVFRGEFSVALDSLVPRLTLYMVDCWATPDPESDYAKTGDGIARLPQTRQEMFYNRVLAKAKTMHDAIVIRAYSPGEAEAFSSMPQDFVFIDADHSKSGVLADLRGWWPVVRPGGLLCGHDWGIHGVKPALEEWLPTVGASTADIVRGEDMTWFLKKPAQNAQG